VHGSYEHFAIASIVMTEDTLRVLGKQEKPTAKQTARIQKPINLCYNAGVGYPYLQDCGQQAMNFRVTLKDFPLPAHCLPL